MITAFGLPLLILGCRKAIGMGNGEAMAFSAIFWIALIMVIYYGFVVGALPFYEYWSAFALILIGGITYLYYRSRNDYVSKEVKASTWFIGYMIVFGALSYMGSLGMGYIQYPWDYLIALAVSIVFFIVSVKQGFETKEIRQVKEGNLPIE
ncbi:hypothetical protein [Vulcanisaeta distributa]|uniref:hypothetical protein n=1 Tax=Vulcanisaeta distributa TaxID=164451 RepID=UPI0006D18E46|nr:hypothetical protein [Vulcanisaeta distributa]